MKHHRVIKHRPVRVRRGDLIWNDGDELSMAVDNAVAKVFRLPAVCVTVDTKKVERIAQANIYDALHDAAADGWPWLRQRGNRLTVEFYFEALEASSSISLDDFFEDAFNTEDEEFEETAAMIRRSLERAYKRRLKEKDR